MARVPEIRILHERPVYSNDYGTLFDDEVRFESSGAVGTYVRWRWDAPYSVAVLPIVGDRVGLVRCFRHSARRWVLEVPKGFGDRSLLPAETALKELREETGLRPTELRPLASVTADPAFCDLPLHLFVALGCREVERPAPESTEVIASVEYHDPVDLMAKLLAGDEPADAVTMLMVQMARLVP